MLRSLVLAAVVSSSSFVFACSSSDDGGSSGSSGQAGGGACAQDTRKDVYTAGISKPADALVVRIVDATPAPPAKGMNAMTIQVADGAGKPVDGATLTLTPFMPDHGHGSAATPVVTAKGDGKYAVEKIYLPMAGLWTLTVKVEIAGAAPAQTTFSFCLDG